MQTTGLSHPYIYFNKTMDTQRKASDTHKISRIAQERFHHTRQTSKQILLEVEIAPMNMSILQPSKKYDQRIR